MRCKPLDRTIQLSLVVFCCLFVIVFRNEVSVNSETCIIPHLAPPPKFSWYKNQQVAVRIDDAWSPEERGYFQQGIEKWNQALNCSGVNFHDFSSIHFASYSLTDAPPDFTVWWQKHLHSASDIFLLSQRLQNGSELLSWQLFLSFRILLVTAFLSISEHMSSVILSI